MRSFENFTECYVGLLDALWNSPEFEASPRGLKVKENLCASFEIRDPRHRIPFVEGRDFSMTYMVAELLWYLSAENSTEWISNYSSFWKNISDDGKTANSAYGSRLFKSHPKIAQGRIDQWDYVLTELKKDPDSRRAIMHIRVPDDSVDAKLDVPCTLALQFFIRDSKLHLVVNMRSSDIIFGLAYDVPAFTVFQEIMAMQLGIELGTYRHVSNSLHLYERHFSMAQKILDYQNIKRSAELADKMGPMPQLDKFFSDRQLMQSKIGELYNFEKSLKSCTSAEEIADQLLSLDTKDCEHIRDWSQVLASHRANKIDNSEKSRLDQIRFFNYKGYSHGK
jgi:thymidylate synthase